MEIVGFWEYYITMLIPILVIMNPISTIGIFLSLTKNIHYEERHKIAFRTSLVAFCVLFFFALTGFGVFQIYSITIDSFRIAGGIALMAIGLNMLFPPKVQNKKTPDAISQIYIVPLAIPMTSGPGAITTTVILSGNIPDLWHQFIFWGAIFTACLINYLVLRFSEVIDRYLGREGLSAVLKIMGLLVCSIAVEFIVVGLKTVFPILAG